MSVVYAFMYRVAMPTVMSHTYQYKPGISIWTDAD